MDTLEVEDLNCTYMTSFIISNNQLEVKTVDDSSAPLEMKFSEEETRKIIK